MDNYDLILFRLETIENIDGSWLDYIPLIVSGIAVLGVIIQVCMARKSTKETNQLKIDLVQINRDTQKEISENNNELQKELQHQNININTVQKYKMEQLSKTSSDASEYLTLARNLLFLNEINSRDRFVERKEQEELSPVKQENSNSRIINYSDRLVDLTKEQNKIFLEFIKVYYKIFYSFDFVKEQEVLKEITEVRDYVATQINDNAKGDAINSIDYSSINKLSITLASYFEKIRNNFYNFQDEYNSEDK